jgi:hypothetical protein
MKTIVYVGTSLDGFIARTDGEFDWLSGNIRYHFSFRGNHFVDDRHYPSNRRFYEWSGARTDRRYFRCQHHFNTLTA